MRFYTTFSLTQLAHASPNYTRCNNDQLTSLNSLVALNTSEYDSEKNYQSCLLIDPAKQTFLVAKSNQIAVEKDEKGEEMSSTYDLTVYLIDGLNHKILNKKLLANDISSDALQFGSITLDTTPFSTLPNTTIIGLKQEFYHNGGISHGNDELQLLKIDDNIIAPIGTITISDGAGTNWDDDCQSKGYHSSEIKRVLVLSNHVTNGLQDIIIKTTKTNEDKGGKTCQQTLKKWQEQTINKFDGRKYQFKTGKLESDGV